MLNVIRNQGKKLISGLALAGLMAIGGVAGASSGQAGACTCGGPSGASRGQPPAGQPNQGAPGQPN